MYQVDNDVGCQHGYKIFVQYQYRKGDPAHVNLHGNSKMINKSPFMYRMLSLAILLRTLFLHHRFVRYGCCYGFGATLIFHRIKTHYKENTTK